MPHFDDSSTSLVLFSIFHTTFTLLHGCKIFLMGSMVRYKYNDSCIVKAEEQFEEKKRYMSHDHC